MSNETVPAEQLLLPCPFCGKADTAAVGTSTNIQHDVDCECRDDCEDYFAVFCDASTDSKKGGCGASGGYQKTEALAIAVWNKRATPEPRAEPSILAPKFKVGDMVIMECHKGFGPLPVTKVVPRVMHEYEVGDIRWRWHEDQLEYADRISNAAAAEPRADECRSRSVPENCPLTYCNTNRVCRLTPTKPAATFGQALDEFENGGGPLSSPEIPAARDGEGVNK